jgi:hypothetical protein
MLYSYKLKEIEFADNGIDYWVKEDGICYDNTNDPLMHYKDKLRTLSEMQSEANCACATHDKLIMGFLYCQIDGKWVNCKEV